ncbi:hypothetical protein NA2_04152 [Nitratireductor pacificus pht-3B]|uniref:Uncharacterized protein n=2 Tax=Nitratireductor TaxID=245876 RepID=K2N8I5_9HYPH|nr:hypothetical protein NA2_04152 [Nitratireductor pacificus pht-3B]
MQEDCTSESIRARLEEFRSTPLIVNEREYDGFFWTGKTWSSQDERFRLRLGQAEDYAFRAGELARDGLFIFHGGITVGHRCRINLCVTHRLEKLEAPGSRQLLPGLPRPAGLVSHVTVERMNFADAWRHAIVGLDEADLERLADLIAPALDEFLQRSVAVQQQEQARRGRHGIPVAGKLHWGWREPAPELVEFHDTCAAFVRQATLAQILGSPFDRYRSEGTDGAYGMYRFIDDPSVTVAFPRINRESPFSRVFRVKLDGVSIPVEIHDLGSTSRAEHRQLALSDDSIFRLETYLAIHPQSLLLKPREDVPPVDRKTADLAVFHARNLWLQKAIIAPLEPEIYGTVEGQVRCSDVIVV